MKGFVHRMLVVAVVAAWSACTPDASPGVSTEVVDSAGIRIVHNGVLDPSVLLVAWGDLDVAPEPALSIGVVEGAKEYQLFRVAAARRLSDGTIAVANGGSREVKLYDEDGTHRATVGGSGEGPSEFRYPSSLNRGSGDTLVVQDFMDRVYFTSAGEFLGRETTDLGAFVALWEDGGGMSEGGAWVPGGTILAPVYFWVQRGGPPEPGPLYRPEMKLVRVSADLESVDTLGDYGGILQQHVDMGGQRGASSIVPPFAANTSWGTGAADGTVVVADNAHPQFEFFGEDGARTIVRWASEPEPITAAEAEAWKDEQRNASWTQGQLPELERGWSRMDLPEHKAYYGRAAMGSDGSVWLNEAEADPTSTTFSVFGPDGRFRGRARIPGRFQVMDAGPSWVLGVMVDETQVEFVQLFGVRVDR